MGSALGTALAKVTVRTEKRSIDVALPEDIPVAELLPYILRHAGEETADAGERHGGWLVRRTTGESLDTRATLAANEIRDGEILHLVPGRLEWPELEYDDVVETIASGARRYGRSWGRTSTRRCGLGVCCAALLAGTLLALVLEPPWLPSGLMLLAAGVLLLAAGIVIARAVPDAYAGAVIAGCGLPYAPLGGYLVTGPDFASPAGFGAPQVLLAAIALVIAGIIGYLGIGVLARLFTAAITIGCLAALGALLGGWLGPVGAAAVTGTVGLGLLPGLPLLAIRIGRLPIPELPQRTAELFAEGEPPEQATVFAAAARTDEVLAGLLTGVSVTGVGCALFLAMPGGGARDVLLVAIAVALLLRSRLFAIPRHRIPLLSAGGLVAAMVVAGQALNATDNADRGLLLLVVIAVGVLAAFAGLTYSRKHPSPFFGRLTDIVDVVAMLALIPLTCYVTGFFTYVRDLMAGIG